ncbi:electron transport complex subunit RsxG [Thioalbus denitrificans]|uniref:Ion-translocating oxidoreductase complex subunit G n=1 Tax=Thioalbus denitrificans TaxID=547122 RepID=A0A369CE59_9GAMM|nr:electron transport complex subunit RsxG [Thioalbus denitrificans]RCX31983.1 electron transport complex protein RnfG [Thioalbus denitrificans]
MTETVLSGWRSRIPYQSGLLGLVSTLAAALLVGANLVTREPIAQREAEDLRASLAQVVPEAIHDNNLLEDTVDIRDGAQVTRFYRARRQGAVSAVAYRMVAQGYSGDIVLLLGVAPDGSILGVRVLSHAETPGLGDRIEVQKSDWILGFSGLSLDNPATAEWAVKKDGGVFDSFSGATITPRAVVAGIRRGLELYRAHRRELNDATGSAAPPR